MPYIKQELREQIDPAVEQLMMAVINLTEDGKHVLAGPGVYNYIITTLLNMHYEMVFTPSYTKVNTVMGILESVKQEYYRRIVVPYEEAKREENGDVY